MGKSMENFTEQKNTLGLYDPQFEHDACGIGAVVDIKGRKSHQTVDDALSIVADLQQNAHTVAGLALGILAGTVLQPLHNGQRIVHRLMALAADQPQVLLQGGRRTEHQPWQRA